jgi:hypothetical protein
VTGPGVGSGALFGLWLARSIVIIIRGKLRPPPIIAARTQLPENIVGHHHLTAQIVFFRARIAEKRIAVFALVDCVAVFVAMRTFEGHDGSCILGLALLFLPNVKDEPRRDLARLVPHHTSYSAVSFRKHIPSHEA